MFGAIQDAAIAALNLPAERDCAANGGPSSTSGSGFCVELAALRCRRVTHKALSSSGSACRPATVRRSLPVCCCREAHILVAPGTGFGAGGKDLFASA
ncbi:hypothetical protein LNP74_22245 [Klebsiella pneumoniae subsp. pneumoniae]|nr:hypothetical protein [Klebsiella pneumoniae subsp. pneumoniae]